MCKDANANLQPNPLNLYLINNVEDIVVFIGLHVLTPAYLFSHAVEKPKLKIISLKNDKHWSLIHTWSDKAFKGTVVNHALSLEITLTVPLIPKSANHNIIVDPWWNNLMDGWSCKVEHLLTGEW